ncbi:hypothetical protein GOODEAATRI_033402, partial [Goodea atripinnis]
AQSPIPMSLGSFMTAPTAQALMRKMKEGPPPPPVLVPANSLYSSSLLTPAHLGPAALPHPSLSARVGEALL